MKSKTTMRGGGGGDLDFLVKGARARVVTLPVVQQPDSELPPQCWYDQSNNGSEPWCACPKPDMNKEQQGNPEIQTKLQLQRPNPD